MEDSWYQAAQGWRNFVLRLLELLGTLLLAFTTPTILIGGMAFDSPGSEDNLIAWLLLALLLIGPVFGWVVRHNASKGLKEYHPDRMIVALALLAIWAGCFVGLNVWFEVRCEGSFSCRTPTDAY